MTQNFKMYAQRSKNVIYDILEVFVNLFPVNIKKNTLLIIKLYGIGDYILWRNSLPYLVYSQKFKNYEITLLGNDIWKDLCDGLDTKYIKISIWQNDFLFKRNLIYRFKLLYKIRKMGFEVVVNANMYRNKRVDDAFVRVCTKSFKVGSTSDKSNVLPFEYGYDKNLYDKLINTNVVDFEFYKNLLFTEQLIDKQLLNRIKLTVSTNSKLDEMLANLKYFVVFVGSSHRFKRWPIENFVSVCNYIFDKYNYTVVVCGGSSEKKSADEFLRLYSHPYINFCAKKDLIELAEILKNAKFLLSVDTGAVHVAAAVSCPVFGIFNGSVYGRYAPYPPCVFLNFYAIYPDKIEADINRTNMQQYKEQNIYIPYSSVTVKKVIKSIEKNFIEK